MSKSDNAVAVAGLYRGFLGRDPDPSAIDIVGALDRGEATLAQVIGAFLETPEFARASGLRAKPDSFTNDQTQFNEFMLLLQRMLLTGRQRVVVDVGARGKDRSNSYDLMNSFGWRGLLIEANPNLAANIREEFVGLDMVLEVCAASDYEGEATFHIGINDDVSSLNQDLSEAWGEIAGEIKVQVVRLPTLLERHEVPRDFDVLSVDIEGEDIKVLNDTVAAGWLPKWVIIEASNDFIVQTLNDAPFSDAVRAAYAIVGQTSANLILERI